MQHATTVNHIVFVTTAIHIDQFLTLLQIWNKVTIKDHIIPQTLSYTTL